MVRVGAKEPQELLQDLLGLLLFRGAHAAVETGWTVRESTILAAH